MKMYNLLRQMRSSPVQVENDAVEVIDDVLVDLMHFACHSLQDPRVSTYVLDAGSWSTRYKEIASSIMSSWWTSRLSSCGFQKQRLVLLVIWFLASLWHQLNFVKLLENMQGDSLKERTSFRFPLWTLSRFSLHSEIMFYACLTRSKSFCNIPDRSCVEQSDDISYFCGLGCRTIVSNSSPCVTWKTRTTSSCFMTLLGWCWICTVSVTTRSDWIWVSAQNFTSCFQRLRWHCWKIPKMIPLIYLTSQGVREDIFAFHLEQWIPLHFALTRVVCALLNAFVKLVIKLKMTWKAPRQRQDVSFVVSARPSASCALISSFRCLSKKPTCKNYSNTDLEKFEDRIIFMSIVLSDLSIF